jgi:hypothetical protein
MAERKGHTEPFQSGQSSNERGPKGEKVPVKFKMAAVRNNGLPDMLTQALTAPPHVYADTVHFHYGGGGKPYKPDGEYGRPRAGSAFKSKATNPTARGKS